MNILKKKSDPGDKFTYFCAEILVDVERLESAGTLNPEHLGYTTCISEDNFNSIFCLLGNHKYKEVTEFIKNICVSDLDVIKTEEIINYD